MVLRPELALLSDWRLVEWLNTVLVQPDKPALLAGHSVDSLGPPVQTDPVAGAISAATAFTNAQLPQLGLPFRKPVAVIIGALFPSEHGVV